MAKARVGLLGIQATHTHFVAAARHRETLRVALRRGGFGHVKALTQHRPVARCHAQIVDCPRLNGERQRQFAQGAVGLGLIKPAREHEVQPQGVGQGARGIGHKTADVVLQGDITAGRETAGRRDREGVVAWDRGNGVGAINSGSGVEIQVQHTAHGIAMRGQADGDGRPRLAVRRRQTPGQFLP